MRVRVRVMRGLSREIYELASTTRWPLEYEGGGTLPLHMT